MGKTTLLRKIFEEVRLIYSCQGFFTEEVRNEHVRVGFDVVTISGQRCVLARFGCILKQDDIHLIHF